MARAVKTLAYPEVIAWVRRVSLLEYGLEFKSTIEYSLGEQDLSYIDVVQALNCCFAVTPRSGFHVGSHVISGANCDDEIIEIACLMKIDAEKLKILDVRRNGNEWSSISL